MVIDFNNIKLEYRDHEISMAFHKGDDKVICQEIMVFGPLIESFTYSLPLTLEGLMYTLQTIKNDIDVIHGD